MTTTRPDVTFREPEDSSFGSTIAADSLPDGNEYLTLNCSGCGDDTDAYSAFAVSFVLLGLGGLIAIVTARRLLGVSENKN